MFFLFDKCFILDDFDLHQKVTRVLEGSHEAHSAYYWASFIIHILLNTR
jgi:hypothetical protein